MMKEEVGFSVLEEVCKAEERLKNVVVKTPLAVNNNLSAVYGANISFKRGSSAGKIIQNQRCL